MTTSKSNEKMLIESGYTYDYYRMIYFNSSTKKVFSFEYIEDNPTSIAEDIKANTAGWKFYFNKDISEKAKQQLISELTNGR